MKNKLIFELARGSRKFSDELSAWFVAPWNFDFLQQAYLTAKLCFSDKYMFYEHQISAGQLSAVSSYAEALRLLFE